MSWGSNLSPWEDLHGDWKGRIIPSTPFVKGEEEEGRFVFRISQGNALAPVLTIMR